MSISFDKNSNFIMGCILLIIKVSTCKQVLFFYLLNIMEKNLISCSWHILWFIPGRTNYIWEGIFFTRGNPKVIHFFCFFFISISVGRNQVTLSTINNFLIIVSIYPLISHSSPNSYTSRIRFNYFCSHALLSTSTVCKNMQYKISNY